MKKTLAILCAIACTAGMLSGCAKKPQDELPAPEDTTAATEQTEPEAPAHVVPENHLELADNAVDFVKNLKLGWNIGNTLDAVGTTGTASETSWGQPHVTKEQLEFVKSAGFTSVRIPVSWSNHVTGEDNAIDPDWMNRVVTVVDWALESDMYVILNSHHDNDRYYPNEEHYAESEKYMKDIWAQIAEQFKDYDERLIFEGMNEPRLANTNKEWWFADNDPEGVASIECIVKLNQAFVDTVRAAGGKNETRFLMVPSHAASAQHALNPAFTMPNDPAGEGRLIVSVHAYSPYDFAMNEKGYKTWDGSKIGELGFMDQLNEKFISNGYGVVIGEFGATNKDNLEARAAWAKDYCGKAAGLGISCFLWDNGGTRVGSENFGMISRLGKFVNYPEILDAMVASYNG